jgi:NAD(P)-dependent dehydrogenase (short-subunit alcohol dehydrogenase family)
VDLRNAVAIVTGGARGIGRAIAEAYARHGAYLVIVDVLSDELEGASRDLERTGVRVLPIVADVSRLDQVEEMVERTETTVGPIDILVNCAGVLQAIGPLWELNPTAWLREISVNLCGTFLCCRAVARRMVERGRGYILNMLGGGVGDPHPYTTGYASSKAGIMRLTEGLAREVEEYGVRVFGIQPGATRTAMTEFILNSPEGQRWRPTFRRIFDQGRDSPAEEVAALAVALVSGRADALSGRYFCAQWDFDSVIQQTDRILQHDLLTLRIKEIA